MIQTARLPLPVLLTKLQSEVLYLTEGWQPHFNRRHYEGGWTVLALRSPGGRPQQIIPDARRGEVFTDTPLMDRCPVIKQLTNSLLCPKMAVRLMNLEAGALIKEHRDHDLSFEQGEARLHIPVFTNPGVSFHVNGEPVPMKEGECWYVNVNLPHKVANAGGQGRIHLVIDCVVNDWLQALFQNGEVVKAGMASREAETLRTIEELRRQNTATTLRLAHELEKNLAPNQQP